MLDVFILRSAIDAYAQMTAITERTITKGEALTSSERAALYRSSQRIMVMLNLLASAVEKAKVPMTTVDAAVREAERLSDALNSPVSR
jgi:hypothetical protein